MNSNTSANAKATARGNSLTEAIAKAKCEAVRIQYVDVIYPDGLKSPHKEIFWVLFTLWILGAIYACVA